MASREKKWVLYYICDCARINGAGREKKAKGYTTRQGSGEHLYLGKRVAPQGPGNDIKKNATSRVAVRRSETKMHSFKTKKAKRRGLGVSPRARRGTGGPKNGRTKRGRGVEEN